MLKRSNQYDIIVVGAGSSGTVLATRLSEHPEIRVALVEAGKDFPKFDQLPPEIKLGIETGAERPRASQGEHDWAYTAKIGAGRRYMEVPRGKITGGTSAINGQVYLRPIPEDFNDWVIEGNNEWSFNKMLPIFINQENDMDIYDRYHGRNGPIPVRRFRQHELVDDQLAFIDAAVHAGFPITLDHNHPASTGVGPLPMNNYDGIRWSTALSYLPIARERPNFTLIPESQVTKLIIKDSTIIGIKLIGPDGHKTIYCGEVILSAGAIGTPQLLMLSGIGDPQHLEQFGIKVIQGSIGVGQNLRDHPMVHVKWEAKSDFPMPENSIGPQKVALRYTAASSQLRNDMISVMRWNSVNREFLMSAAVFLSKSKGFLQLKSSDPFVHPALYYNLLDNPEDLRRLRGAVRMHMEFAQHRSFKNILKNLKDPLPSEQGSNLQLNDWLINRVSTMHHISCTSRMGAEKDPLAVTDQKGVVFGVKGLRVADLSILPDCPRANTNAIAIAIGERISEFITK